MTLYRVLLFVGLVTLPAAAQRPTATNPVDLVREGEDQTKALQVNRAIYQAIGFGNTFMVTTPEGNVIIDTSIALRARQHVRLLKAVNAGPVKYIILTHAHGDHTGGIPLWKSAETKIVAQENHVEFMHYQTRLAGFFSQRNAAQFALPRPPAREWAGNYGATIAPNVLFRDKYEFELGGTRFELYATPGETPDHLTVWIPEHKAAFIGDNYYASFPNIYTLRGTQPRWALEYVNSLNKVMSLKPELLLPSHGGPIRGNAEITRVLTRYRDAIQYVHDETVKGMNAGKDVYSLMREIKLPPELDVGEAYGKLSWSIRGIYEGYAGWFDLNPAGMYEKPTSSVYGDLVELAGGADAVVRLALRRFAAGQLIEALHLTNIAVASAPNHRPLLEAQLKVLEALKERCRNSNERGWLDYSIGVVRSQLSSK